MIKNQLTRNMTITTSKIYLSLINALYVFILWYHHWHHSQLTYTNTWELFEEFCRILLMLHTVLFVICTFSIPQGQNLRNQPLVAIPARLKASAGLNSIYDNIQTKASTSLYDLQHSARYSIIIGLLTSLCRFFA